MSMSRVEAALASARTALGEDAFAIAHGKGEASQRRRLAT